MNCPGLLGDVVSDAVEHSMGVLAREFVAVGPPSAAGPSKSLPIVTVGTVIRAFDQLGFEVVVLRLPWGQAEPPPVVVDDDVDVIGIVEGRGGAIVRVVVESHFGEAICQISLLNSCRFSR